jgi:hypothetical protein
MALGAADDYLRWLELRGQRHGAVEVVERSVRNARALAYQLRSNADETTRDDAAFEAGWRAAAEWAKRDDLVHDIDSPAYRIDRFNRLKRLAVEPTPRHRQPSYVLEQIMNNSTDPWAQGIARTYLMGSPEKAGGKQCDVDGFACDSTERCEECPENGS